MTDYTGRWRIGRRVHYDYHTGAVSCCMNRRAIGDGIIDGTARANGRIMYSVEGLLLFEHEILGYGTHPRLLPLHKRPQWSQ